MNVYLESSVIVSRITGQQPAIKEWGQWGHAFTSELSRIEVSRAIQRLRMERRIDDAEVGAKQLELKHILAGADLVSLAPLVLDRAAQPFATAVRTLDAIHLATALFTENEIEGALVFLTHDRQLGIAARALGFDVRGVAL